MRGRRARGLVAACALGVLGLAGPPPASPSPSSAAGAIPERRVRLPDHRALNFRCAGTGSPTVLLEGGFAASSLAWSKVEPLLARRRRVCAYDRAGYGLSDPGPMPRDGAAVAADLDQGLRAARIEGPYIMVGHSAGGLYARLFADRRPRDVVGMVLVDPSIEHQDQRFAAIYGSGAGSLAPMRQRAERCLAAAQAGALPSAEPGLTACAPMPTGARPYQDAASLKPAFWLTQISELDTLWAQTSDEAAAGRRDYGDMPLIVLTADGTYAGAPPSLRAGILAYWRNLHAEIAARSSRGTERLVTASSHMMMFDRPDAIVAAIDEVASEIHQGEVRPPAAQ